MKKLLPLIALIFNFFAVELIAQNPSFAWAKSLGGTFSNQGSSVTVDPLGNVYTTGCFAGTVDFDPGIGTYTLNAFGNNDVFISKLDAAGNFVWAKQLGGTLDERGYGIAVDASANVLIIGYFSASSDFDPSAGTFTLSPVGSGTDVFISKLDANGNFVWAKQLGGGTTDIGYGIAVDASFNVYTTGLFQGTADFDPGPGTFNLNSVGGSQDIFVSKLNSAGNFVWAKQFGSVATDVGQAIALDASANVYTTGYFQNTADFDPGAGTFTLTSAGFNDVFISKLDVNGNFVWAKQFGNVATDVGQAIALDASANVYTTGYFQNTADFDPGAGTFTLTSAGFYDVFVSKLDVNGNFVWAKNIGGSGYELAAGIALDASDNVYTTGVFQNITDFDPGIGTFTLSTSGNSDVFISKLDPLGNFVWAVNLGGSSSEEGKAIALDLSNNILTTGYFQGTCDFEPGVGTFTLTSIAGEEIFIHKMGQATVNVNEIIYMNENGVYPNPFNWAITVVSSDLEQTVQIFNIIGEIVYSSKIESKRTEIDLSDQPSGIYFVRIGSVTKKIIKN